MTDATKTEHNHESAEDVVDELGEAAAADQTSIGAILQEMQHASFVPVLLVPALAVVTPLSGIPLFSSTCGILIALVSAQMLVGRKSLWLPKWIRNRKIPRGRLRKAALSLRKPARWLDRHTHERFSIVVSPPMDRIIHLMCMVCGLAMPPLELVPFSSSILGAAVVLLSLTLLARDGLVALIAYATIGIAAFTVVYAVQT